MDIQVSNLNPSLIEADVQRLFAPFGEISSIEIYRDKLNNRSQGKALIKMPVKFEAQKAIASLQGTLVGGKSISVIEVPNMGETDFLTSMRRI
jgi:RNA recognition motif-containing protein